jgi:hypothetical protein
MYTKSAPPKSVLSNLFLFLSTFPTFANSRVNVYDARVMILKIAIH